MSKIKLYKFLGTFIPYFKRKIMTIEYYTNNWTFLTSQSYSHTSVPRIGDEVILSANETTNTYTVLKVRYEGNDIKILLQ